MKNILHIPVLLLFISSCDKGERIQTNSIESQVDSLVALMTIEEKIGQMTQLCFSTITLDGTKTLALDPELFRKAIIDHKVGSFLSGTGSASEWMSFIKQIQDIAIKESRLGIPLIIGVDHVHGANYVDEGTIFPHNLTLSCGFDQYLIEDVAKVVARETAPLALSWNFAPVLDVGKNPYWPRLYETFGEDPYMCSVLGSAFVGAYQLNDNGHGLSACAKHFIGYSDPKSGWDRTPAEIPDQILFEQFIPPFKAAIDAGVKTVMVNSGEVNGEAVHGSEYYLQEILRTRLGFDGVVLTDIKDITKMVEMHNAYESYESALLAAINAGIDMAMSCNHNNFQPVLKKLIEEGKVPIERIDQSVRRILKLKFELNLFQQAYPNTNAVSQIGSRKNYQVAKRAAAESVVLLKNDGILPLNANQKIIVSGFAANSRKMMNGPWTLEWMGADEDRHRNTPTLFEAMNKDGDVRFVEELDYRNVSDADVIVLTLGELPYSEFKGNIGDLNLDEEQCRLLQRTTKFGKPIILLLVEGRPRIISDYVDDLGSILFTGYPGHGGPEAISDILYGKVNPSGRLSFSYPRTTGYYSPYYHKPSEYHHSSSKPYSPLFEFGYGLSYTTFEYGKLKASDSLIHAATDTIALTVEVSNTGQMDGKEVAMWFIHDEVGKITRPLKQLKYFEKRLIQSGESSEFRFDLVPSVHLSYPDRFGNSVLENGSYNIMIGDQRVKVYLDI